MSSDNHTAIINQPQNADDASTTLASYLDQQQHLDLLRFITCGSVDDGKSTLIGRLLWEVQQIFDDQLAALQQDSRKYGTQGNKIDFALLVDGLSAEREQGITIDVAYRFFATDRRKFIVADTPGHEQYTRNMITGASTAQAAVILVDARKGILTQTRRHSYLVSLIGIRNVILAVNKMDLVHHSERTFNRITDEYRQFASQLGITNITAIPLSALHGDNVTTRSDNIAWYEGPTLIEALESIDVQENASTTTSFRMPVQWVNRPHLDFRGFCGTIVSGTIKPGDRVCVLPAGRQSHVARIVTMDGDLPQAVAGQSITLTLTDEIDVSRGNMISSTIAPAEVAEQFETTIVWMIDQPMLPGRPYFLKIGTATVTATITRLKHKVNINTLEEMAATQLNLNEIGVCNIALDKHIPFDPYATNRNTGSFILIDKLTNATVGAGMLNFALRRSHNIHLQYLDVNKEARAAIKHQHPRVLWFTGLSGAGKSTIANKVEMQLHALGYHTYLLDGDNVRHGINKDLGFTEVDRIENIRRVAEVAKLMLDAGLIVLTAFISPFRAERDLARALFADGEFVEIYVDTPLDVAESRDPKGLYHKARRGELKNFTGIDSPYEPPIKPDIKIDTVSMSVDEGVKMIVDWIVKKRS